jgi:hypothetical protein
MRTVAGAGHEAGTGAITQWQWSNGLSRLLHTFARGTPRTATKLLAIGMIEPLSEALKPWEQIRRRLGRLPPERQAVVALAGAEHLVMLTASARSESYAGSWRWAGRR